jgi:carboxyl-terminal processing protease
MILSFGDEFNMTGKGKSITLILIAALLTAIAIATATRFSINSREKSVRDYISFFKEIVTLVKTNYVEKVDDKKLMESAINGMLAALDPHNAYMPPEPYKEMQVQMSGSFGGVGIEITIKDGRLTVISPLEDTPAFRAGIKSGDFIWMIDNALVRSMNISEAVKRMRGPPGTSVTLTILREGADKPFVVHLKREIIRIKSVKYRTLGKGYGYIRIAQFQERTGEEFTKALQDLHKENGGALRGLVLDLRNNPGGLVDPAIDVAGRFVGERLQNGLIVSMKGRDPSSRQDLSATIGEKEPAYPLVVLINIGSASASEIVAGALQDYKRAVIMGTQSFGKGSVQSVIPMHGGAGLKLTTARYYTPKGRSIQARGITPDIIVSAADRAKPMKDEEHDIREEDLDGHIDPAGNKEIKRKKQNPLSSDPKNGEAAGDYQLSRALDLLKGIDLLGLPK